MDLSPLLPARYGGEMAEMSHPSRRRKIATLATAKSTMANCYAPSFNYTSVGLMYLKSFLLTS